jgi:hypothetical protein
MGIQINGQTDNISAVDGSLTISGAELPNVTNLNATGIVTATGFVGNVTGNLTGTASTATAAATAFGLSGSPTLSGITSVSTTNLTVNGNAYPSDGVVSGARNRIINGDMRIDQRNNGASVTVTTTNVYSVDRFRADINSSGTGRFSVQQSSTAPTGFVNSLQVTVTTADAAPSANFGYSIQQLIEGTNISDLALGTSNAQPITLSFWVRSSLTGTFPVTFLNENSTRAFGAQYTVSAANTWEIKTILVSGLTDGTWLTNTSIGIRIVFGLGGGTSRTMALGYQTIADLVQTNVTGSAQLIATNGATFYLTGVQLEVGTVATPFERRSFGQELALCQRYYQKIINTGSNTSRTMVIGGFNATRSFGGISLSTPMRTNTPAMTKGGNMFLETFGLATNLTVTDIGRYGDMNGSFIGVEVNAASGIVGGTAYTLSFGGGSNAYITLDTEL